jgi:hypothetical protein
MNKTVGFIVHVEIAAWKHEKCPCALSLPIPLNCNLNNFLNPHPKLILHVPLHIIHLLYKGEIYFHCNNVAMWFTEEDTFFNFIFIFYCAGWGYIVAFIKVVTMYQMYQT